MQLFHIQTNIFRLWNILRTYIHWFLYWFLMQEHRLRGWQFIYYALMWCPNTKKSRTFISLHRTAILLKQHKIKKAERALQWNVSKILVNHWFVQSCHSASITAVPGTALDLVQTLLLPELSLGLSFSNCNATTTSITGNYVSAYYWNSGASTNEFATASPWRFSTEEKRNTTEESPLPILFSTSFKSLSTTISLTKLLPLQIPVLQRVVYLIYNS